MFKFKRKHLTFSVSKHLTFSVSKHPHFRSPLSTAEIAETSDNIMNNNPSLISISNEPNLPNPISPPHSTPSSTSLIYSIAKPFSQIKQIHAKATVTGMTHKLFVANKILHTYTQHKALDDAYSVFDNMGERDNFSWSAMVGGFAKVGDYKSCLRTFRNTVDVEMRRMVRHLVYKSGMHLDCFLSAAVVDMYVKCGVIDDARKVFDGMGKRDLVTYMVMVSGYAESGNAAESMVLFERMMGEGIFPDKVAMVTVAFACAKLGAMHKAKFIHEYILRKRFSLDVILGTVVIDMYAKCGSLDMARKVLQAMLTVDLFISHKNAFS